MSVLKKSTLSLLCAGLLMSSCTSRCSTLFGLITAGIGCGITVLSSLYYKHARRFYNEELTVYENLKNFNKKDDTLKYYIANLSKYKGYMKLGQYGMGFGAFVTACGLYSLTKNWKKADV